MKWFTDRSIFTKIITGYAFHKQAQAARKERRWARLLEPVTA